MDDLEVIANLEFGKLIERISRETQERLVNALAGKPAGGIREHTKLQVYLDAAEQTCQEYARIWQSLLEEKNGGLLTRENIDYIAQKVIVVAAARKSSLASDFREQTAGINSEVGRRMDSIVASIRRDLEIRIRRQEALPEKKAMSEKQPIHVTIHSAANVNLGSQIGTINAVLTSISQKAGSDDEIVGALRQLTDAVEHNTQLQETEKRDTLEVVEEIAKQAQGKPEARSAGKLKALISGLPALLNASKELLELWDKLSPSIRHYFGF